LTPMYNCRCGNGHEISIEQYEENTCPICEEIIRNMVIEIKISSKKGSKTHAIDGRRIIKEIIDGDRNPLISLIKDFMRK